MKVLLLMLVSILSSFSSAQSDFLINREESNRPSMLVIGTAHFQNSGRDLVNVDLEDVMSDTRQEEIQALLEMLASFKPTHIAVEFPLSSQDRIDEVYTSYLEGDYELTRNEAHQLGYRLGALLGLDRVYGVDWNGNPPGAEQDYDWFSYGEANGHESRIANISDPDNRPNTSDMSGQTIAEWLVRINQPEILQASHRAYFDIAMIGDGEIQPGPSWVGTWYARNLKIFTNLVRLAEKPTDRILVIYGLGHAYLLNQFAVESGAFNLVSLQDVIEMESMTDP